jgi:hypothetical protein
MITVWLPHYYGKRSEIRNGSFFPKPNGVSCQVIFLEDFQLVDRQLVGIPVILFSIKVDFLQKHFVIINKILTYCYYKFDELVKSPKTVMPDLIPAKNGIFDRHPEPIEITGFLLDSIRDLPE